MARKTQETCIFGGAGHFEPITLPLPKAQKQAKPRKPKAQPVTVVEPVRMKLGEIREAAEGALARLAVLDVTAARQDFEWIIQLADEGLKAG